MDSFDIVVQSLRPFPSVARKMHGDMAKFIETAESIKLQPTQKKKLLMAQIIRARSQMEEGIEKGGQASAVLEMIGVVGATRQELTETEILIKKDDFKGAANRIRPRWKKLESEFHFEKPVAVRQ